MSLFQGSFLFKAAVILAHAFGVKFSIALKELKELNGGGVVIFFSL